MHPILRINEILAVIVTFVDTSATDSWYHPKSTLLNVALSCKTLSEVALDQLWKQQSCLFPLLKLCGAIEERELEKSGTYRPASEVARELVCPKFLPSLLIEIH